MTIPLPILCCIVAIGFVYWLGYGDGKLAEQEKNLIEAFDKLIRRLRR